MIIIKHEWQYDMVILQVFLKDSDLQIPVNLPQNKQENVRESYPMKSNKKTPNACTAQIKLLSYSESSRIVFLSFFCARY